MGRGSLHSRLARQGHQASLPLRDEKRLDEIDMAAAPRPEKGYTPFPRLAQGKVVVTGAIALFGIANCVFVRTPLD